MNVDIHKTPDLFHDFEKSLEFLRKLPTEIDKYPESLTYFHVYTEVRNEKELVAIESFLATQNLEKCKLIVWSDYDISNNQLIAPYKKFLDLRVYDPIKEASSTPLQGHTQLLAAKDSKYYLQSDLLRIMALYKYGGVWFDMDVLLLRDFLPILDQEYMYMWGSETDFKNQGACATVLSLKPQSEFASDMIEELKITPIRPASTCWGKDMFANMYKKKPFNVLPSAFFNTEWCINSKYEGVGTFIENCWFEKPCDDKFLFLEAFSWHWHNSSHKNKRTVENSKFDKLTKIIRKKLRARGIIDES